MANSVFTLEVGEERIRFRSRNIRCWSAAVGRNDVMLFWMMLEKSGDIRTGPHLEGPENPDFIFASFGLLVSPEGLVDVALEINANVRSDAIL